MKVNKYVFYVFYVVLWMNVLSILVKYMKLWVIINNKYFSVFFYMYKVSI